MRIQGVMIVLTIAILSSFILLKPSDAWAATVGCNPVVWGSGVGPPPPAWEIAGGVAACATSCTALATANGGIYNNDCAYVAWDGGAKHALFNGSYNLSTTVNGSCGTADGTTVAVAPSGATLCSPGTASAVSGTGPWTWTCAGQGGGTDSPLCSANFLSGTSIFAACPFTQGDGQYVFTFPEPFKALLNWGANAPTRQPYHERTYAFSALPGSYDIWSYTHDGYTTRSATLPAEQLHEQYWVKFYNRGSIVANPYLNCATYPATCGWPADAQNAKVQSGGTLLGSYTTTDLVDGVNFADQLEQIGDDIHLGGSAGSTTDSIRVRHIDAPAGSAAGASSVRPTCIALRPALPMMSCPGNLLTNGNFEDMTVTTNIPGWTKNPNTLNTYVSGEFIADGARAAFIAGTSQLYQWVPVTPGKTYQLTFSAGTHDPARDETVEIEFEDASGVDVGGHTVVNIDYDVDLVAYPNKLKAYSMTVTAPAGSVRLRVLARNLAAPGPRYKVDAFCLTNVAAPTGIVTVSPNPLDFGTLPVGGAPQSRIVTITNTGALRVDGTILLPNVAPAGTYSCAAGDCSFGVDPGMSIQKTILLSATALGNLNANASLVGNISATPLALTAVADDKAKIELMSYVDGALIPTNNPSPHTLPPMGGASIAIGATPVDYQFQVTNSGATPLSYTVDIPSFMSANYSCNGGGGSDGCAASGIPSGGTKIFIIRFDPAGSGIGDKNGTITITNTSANPGGGNIDLNFSAHVINNVPVFQVLTSTAPQPILIAGGYEVDFGDVYLGDTVTRILNFYNDGDLPMDVSYGALSVPFAVSAGSASNIPPSGFHPVSIDFTPQAAGVVSVNMTVTTDGYSGGTALVRLKGRGLTAPKLKVSVPTLTGGPNVYDFADVTSKVLDFGDGDVNLPALSKTITIDNTLGSADATITDFSDPGVPFGRPTGATTILAGESKDFTFTFDPSVLGGVSANVNISSSDYGSPFTITLLGNGIITAPNITPNPVNLGRVLVSRYKDVVIALTSNDPLGRDLGKASISLLDSAQFSCIDPSPCEVTLQNGIPQNITLRFSPSSFGNKTTNLVFTSADVNIDGVTIPVSGTGVRPLLKFEEK